MRRMADSDNAANLPTGWDLYAGYVDGKYRSYAPAVARFGASKVVPIAVFSTTNAGTVGDVESEDMTAAGAVAWVRMRRAAGVDPTIYTSVANWSAVQLAFEAAGVAQPHYWLAAYPGNGQALYPGSIAHQYADVGPYDASVVADYWPGVDHAPTPAPPPYRPAPVPVYFPGDNMQVQNLPILVKGGSGWYPSPVNAAKFVAGWIAVENPDITHGYDNVPTVIEASATPGPNSPNGALILRGLVPDGTYTLVAWFTD